MQAKHVTIPDIIRQKRNKPIVMLTAYDYLTAKILDETGIDMILVGDSVGTTLLGFSTTIPVGMPEMMHHVSAVARACTRSLVIADMPFGSFQTSEDDGIQNAISFLKCGAQAVKLEGSRYLGLVSRLVESGIPVMGHIGLTPQSVHVFGGHRIQGRTPDDHTRLIAQARDLEAAGVFCIVIEGVPSTVAKDITGSICIPTIGIGAGPYCDGQVLVITDLLGMDPAFKPKFVRRYANLHETIKDAAGRFRDDVMNGSFPSQEESYDIV